MAHRGATPAVPIALLVLLAGGARAETLAVLPLQDVGGVAGGRAQVEALLLAGLRAKGYEVASGDAVEEVLEAERIRHLDSLTTAARERIVAATGATTVVLGTIHSYAEGRNPLVALSLRAIEAGGGTRWSSVVARSGEDEQGAFGTRTVARDEVAAAAVEDLLSDFPAPGAPPAVDRVRGKPFHLGGPRTWCAAALLEPGPHRVVVLPMEA
ncbi:MAG TPA: hypothetical protein VFM29_07435, partial [Vicinamibacteria bacterium]|nr:hypothetical protein [Vicinamibacteria bacterium]